MASSEPRPARARPADEQRSSAAPRIGQRYRVLAQLGRGGAAVVYRVRDLSQARDFALKQLVRNESERGRELLAQFEREYWVLAQLSHPSVVQVYDFGVDAAGPYYTMELLEAGDVSARAPWPFAQACRHMMQICSALSLLHSRGFVHRDISPRNVRASAEGSAKLIDFGAMTEFGRCAQVVGTPGFVAPEVVHRLALDARTDLFSLGATLYYAITGCAPFSARTLAELAAAWGHEPVPLRELVPGIPSALEALVSSMLRMDPARRPGSAFEVMQRLAASAGVPVPESAEIARACLSTPLLIGREPQQRRFRQCLRGALQGIGHGLLVQGASGLGRTRLLDTCLVEAQLGAATVLRVAGRAAGASAFASARQLAVQLLEALPEQAVACADASDLTATLFCSPDAGPSEASASARLRAFDASGEDAYRIQAALQHWLLDVCRTQPLVIAVDDIDCVDDRSIALLVALLRGAGAARLLVLGTAPNQLDVSARPALAALIVQCVPLVLTPWSAEETDALFASVFFVAPYVGLVSDRIQQIAAGNPRESLALAQHMLDRQLIHFTDGNWCLPAELAVSDLPATAQDALRSQLAALPHLPRLLAEAQTLTLRSSWSRADYHALAAISGAYRPDHVDEALALLLRQGVVKHHAGAYTLSHLATQACLATQLTDADRKLRQLALAELSARRGQHRLYEVHHLLQGGESERALARLAPLLDGTAATVTLQEHSGLGFQTIADILERAHAPALADRRRPRETLELARLLIEFSIVTDSRLYYRYAPAWLAQLERDSGLRDYWAADPNADPSTRLQQALQDTAARYASAPEPERGYRIDQAIPQLAQHVVISIAIGVRTADAMLLASLPELLAPFAALSPILHALWQNAVATNESAKGQEEQARSRWLEVYARLAQVSERDVPHLDLQAIRHAIAYAVASREVSFGYQTAEQWIAIIEGSDLQRVSAQLLLRALCVFDGDLAGAERHRKQAELFAVQSITRPMFDPPLWLELSVQMHAGDLTAVKQVVDRSAPLARDWPGWRPFHDYAQGCFQQLRGDLAEAKVAFERALAWFGPEQAGPPPRLQSWLDAATGYIRVLSELGRVAEARAFGLQVLERCEASNITTGGYAHVRALALAEAKLGDHASAVERLDRLIAKRSQLRPSMRALDLEARARVAIWAKDAAAANHFTQLATQGAAAVGGGANRARLLDEAERAGVALTVPASEFENAVRHPKRTPSGPAASNHLLTSFSQLERPEARASQVLRLLTEEAGAAFGHLYYAQNGRLVRVATLGATPDPALDAFANGYVRQYLVQSGMTTIFTDIDCESGPALGNWTDRAGKPHAIALLQTEPAASCVGLVALCDRPANALSPAYHVLAAAIAQRLLAIGDVERCGIQ